MVEFPVVGTVATGFEPLARAFTQLLDEQPQGAALAVYRDGEPLVDVWGGARDKARTLGWQADTRVNIFSAGKPLVAVTALQLVAGGNVQLGQAVADIWPAFGAHGKAHITLEQILCHRSGLNAFRAPVADDAIFDLAQVHRLIENESPWWDPGSAQGYSPILYGWVLGEIVRRASGSDSFNAAFTRAVAAPLGLTARFGVPKSEQASLAEVSAMRGAKPEPGVLQLGRAMKDEPQGVVNKAFCNPMTLMVGTNGEAWRGAEIPAANGHASARDLARFYDSLLNDDVLLPHAVKDWCWREQSAGDDRILQTPMRFSLGFTLSQRGGDRQLGRGARAFGHAGAGGCLGFADPEYGLSFAFVSNQMAQSLLIDSRCERLINALYQLL